MPKPTTRPTVNDIAREAGVSLATVDRVLNARPGVRAKTVQAVNEAILRLGYVRDLEAANLARQRRYRLAFLLPDSDSQFVQTLDRALHEAATAARAQRTEVLHLRYPAQDPHGLAATLADLPRRGVDGVALMAPETPVVRDAVRALRGQGIPVVALVSDLPAAGCDHFVGIDSHAAGRTAGVLMGRFLGPNPATVMVIAPSMQLRDAVERRRGFDAVMQHGFPQIEVLPTLETHGQAATLRRVVTEQLSDRVAGIYLLGSGHRALSELLAERGLAGRIVTLAHELTPHTRAALMAGQLDAIVTQNVGHVARSALRVLRARVDGLAIDPGQERLRIEVLLRENLPPEE